MLVINRNLTSLSRHTTLVAAKYLHSLIKIAICYFYEYMTVQVKKHFRQRTTPFSECSGMLQTLVFIVTSRPVCKSLQSVNNYCKYTKFLMFNVFNTNCYNC